MTGSLLWVKITVFSAHSTPVCGDLGVWRNAGDVLIELNIFQYPIRSLPEPCRHYLLGRLPGACLQ